MTLDPRLQNIIDIGPTRSVVGAPSGGLDAILNKSSATLAKAMTTLRQRAAEVRDHSQLLPSEKSRRLCLKNCDIPLSAQHAHISRRCRPRKRASRACRRRQARSGRCRRCQRTQCGPANRSASVSCR